MDRGRSTVPAASGILAPVTLLLTATVGAVASPTYDWPTEPFSVLGVPGEPTAVPFAAGLVLAGLLGLPFAVRRWRAGRRWVGGLYALVCVSLVGAGLFPFGSVWHEVFGAGLLFGIPVLLLAAGVTDWRGGSQRDGSESQRDGSAVRRDGAVALLLGAVSLAVWLPYDFGIAWAQIGYGAAELVAFLAFALWSVRSTVRHRRRDALPADGAGPTDPDAEEVAR